MTQPIKKKIQEAHPDMIQEAPFRTLLVDGNSLLFVSMSDPKVNSDKIHYGGIFQFLLQLRMMLMKGEFKYIYVFFDNEYSGYLRYKEYAPYKANRDKNYADYGLSDYMKEVNAKVKSMMTYFNKKNGMAEKHNGEELYEGKKKSEYDKFIDANFDRERDCLCRYFNELYIRWNIDEVTEGDDQIAYYCMHKKPNEKIVIMSADMDLAQLISDDICIYNLQHDIKKFITPKNFYDYFGYDYHNVLVKKIFTGDLSDNIGNIKGLSEDGFFKLMPEAKKREVTVEEVKAKAQSLIDERISKKKKPLKVHENILAGISNKPYVGDFYEINTKIIDLKHPLLSKEAEETMEAMMYAPQDPDGRSFKNLYQYVLEDKIEDVIGDTKFASFFAPFKSFAEREIKMYEESLKE